MNEQIKKLAIEAGLFTPGPDGHSGAFNGKDPSKFAQLIVAECSRLNKAESYELSGVIADVEADNGFDELCLNTVKRVHQYLSSDALDTHFGVDEDIAGQLRNRSTYFGNNP